MAAAAQTRWTLDVARTTDESLRSYLQDNGEATPEALAQFVEEAVREHLFRASVEKIKQAHAHLSEQEVTDLVDEAIAWARSPEGREC